MTEVYIISAGKPDTLSGELSSSETHSRPRPAGTDGSAGQTDTGTLDQLLAWIDSPNDSRRPLLAHLLQHQDSDVQQLAANDPRCPKSVRAMWQLAH